MMKIFKKIFKDPFFLAALSAVLLRLSYPKSNLWALAWFAFVPLFFALENQKFWKALLVSFLCGFLFFVLTVFWLVHVTVPGMFVLCAYLGVYFACFGIGVRFAKKRLDYGHRLAFVPALWVLLEFTRSTLLTGFPWALLGSSQTLNLFILQAADIFGAFGLSFIVMFVNAFFFELVRGHASQRYFRDHEVLIPVVIVLCWLAYGSFRLNQTPEKACGLRVSLVQGNIPQEIKWVYSFKEGIFNKYRLLTEISDLKDEPDLIVWPETSFPDYVELGENDQFLKDFAKSLATPLLVGSIRLQGMRYYNSALLFSSAGKVGGIYDKLHLVPFGEYIPARRFLPFVERILPIEDFKPGARYEIFSVVGRACPRARFGVLICFEDIFSGLARGFVQRGADFLVNMTNDAWFGDTASPYQHMQASVLRAVENRVYVVRAANTGVSCFIDDNGRVVKTVRDLSGKETFVTGYGSGLVFKPGRRSLYTKIGDIFAVLCVFYAAGMLLARRRDSA